MKKLYALLLVSMIATMSISAQSWTKMELPETGKHITDMIERDGVLYVTTDNGLFKSNNDGQSWELVNRSIRGRIMDMTADGKLVSNWVTQLLASNSSNELELFKDLGFFIVNGTTNMITAQDGSIHLIYAEQLQMKYFISSDNGVTFTQQSYDVAPHYQGAWRAPFQMDPLSGDLYYYGNNNKFQRSTDNGLTYAEVGPEIDLWNLNNGFCINAENGHLYIQENVGNQNIVKKSEDHGETWLTISPGSMFGQYIAAHGEEVIIYGGNEIFYSNDDGDTWTNYGSMYEEFQTPDLFLFTSEGTILAANVDIGNQYAYGISEVNFDNETIMNRCVGLDYSWAQGMSYNGSRISASFSKWAHYSDDNGLTWTALKGYGAHSKQTFVANDGTVYAESWLNGISNNMYVQNEMDSMELLLDSQGEEIFQMKYMFEDESNNIFLVSYDKMYKSSNGGPFTIVPDAPINAFGHVSMWYSSSQNRIYSIGGTNAQTSYSDDQGQTWVDGQSAGGIAELPFQGEDEILLFYLSTSFDEQGYYSSTDLQSWTQVSNTTTNLVDNDTYIFGLNSTDFIANNTTEVLFTEDSGANWMTFEEGIETFDIFDWQGQTTVIETKVLEKSSGRMFLSANGGVYYWDYDSTPDNVQDWAQSDKLNVYPNPLVNGQELKIADLKNWDRVQIYNLSGRLVYESNDPRSAITFDLNTGVYLVHVVNEGNNYIEKLIVK